MAETILKEREADITRTGEDDCTGEPDFETVEEEAVDTNTPTEEQVVHEREGSTSSDTICNNSCQYWCISMKDDNGSQ